MGEAPEFDWSPLGEPFWRAAAQACSHKPNEAQLKFAVGRHNGLTATDAATRAGYSGTNEQMRSHGSRVSKSTAVTELLAYAFAETGTGDDGVIKGAEPKRILSRIARTGDNASRIRAVEGLQKIEATERDERREQAEGTGNPTDTLFEIAAINPELAAWLAAASNVKLDFDAGEEVASRIEEARRRIAISWVRENPDQAVEYVRAYTRSNGHAHAEEEMHDVA